MPGSVNQDLDHLSKILPDEGWAAQVIPFEAGKSSLQERLQGIQAFLGGQVQMSEASGMSVSGIKAWMRGTEPGLLKIRQLAETAGLSIEYVATGRIVGEADLACERARFDALKSSMGPVASHRREEVKAWTEKVYRSLDDLDAELFRSSDQTVASHRQVQGGATWMLQQSFVSVPRFEVRPSAGAGSLAQTEEVSEHFAVGRDWLRRNLPAWASINAQLGVLDGSGDSMEPTIRDGDTLMIVRGVEWHVVERGGIFVFTLDERLLLKRLQVLANGDLRIISDNPHYDAFIVPAREISDRVTMHGQVFFVGGRPRSIG